MSIKIPSVHIPVRNQGQNADTLQKPFTGQKPRKSQWPGGLAISRDASFKFPRSSRQSLLYHISRMGMLGL